MGSFRDKLGLYPDYDEFCMARCNSAEPKSTPPQPSLLHGKTLLLIDDSPPICLLFGKLMERDGATVTTCTNPRQGLELALQEHFDLVIMDIEMPPSSGIDAAAELRQAGYQGTLLALSGHNDDEHKTAALNAGFNGYLFKDGDCLTFTHQLLPWLNL